ncbi:MAG: hypothetical protein CML21_00590 [Rheinheimera sp.]|nr:hypothetical protein [Rheinheimera sp.]|tara:strand:- start:9293 stop:9568 length:276 start_codon:yes stop_codon:yes gene_type:complete
MVKSFVLQLIDAAAGEKISHFRTVKNGDLEVKIYFTDSKIILANFQGRQFLNVESRIRGRRESLLGFETMVSEAIRINAPNAHFPPRLLPA